MKISIIGIGRLGGALAIALDKKDCKVENLFAREDTVNADKIAATLKYKPRILPVNNFAEISSDVILIATQDSEIESVAGELASKLLNKPQIFHTSGSLSSDILQKLKAIGCQTGSIHPLVSISDSRLGAERFTDAYFCVEGEEDAVETAEEIVSKLGGNSFSIETKYKTLYHASAVTACGHLVALIDAAIEMLGKCGLDKTNAQHILLPLIESTVENLKAQTTSEALTGTFARADVATLEKHLKILRETVSPEALEVYLQLGARSLHLAEMQGANQGNLDQMRKQIRLAKTNLK